MSVFMPKLKTDKREQMAQFLFSGYKAPQAYSAAGYSGSPNNAYVLAREKDVKERVAELKDIQLRENEKIENQREAITQEGVKALTKGDLVSHLLDNLTLAKEERNPVAANKTIELMGEISGYLGKAIGKGTPSNAEPSNQASDDIGAGTTSVQNIADAFGRSDN